MNTRRLGTVLMLLAGAAFGATPLHHYNFDGDSATDLIGSSEGRLLGGAVVVSGALTLNGTTAYVQFDENVIPGSDFSVTLFAQELTPASDRMELISQGRSYGPGFYLGYYGTNRQMRVGDQWQSTRTRYPADGLMHHYAVTSDGLGCRLYIDGVCVASNAPIQIGSSGNYTRLGQQFEPWGEFFHGALDELWVYSGALTPEEVALLAAAKPLPPKLSIEVSQVKVCWQSQTNVMYQVQYQSALTQNEWVDLGTVMPGIGGNTCVFDDVAGPQRTYRVVASPPSSP